MSLYTSRIIKASALVPDTKTLFLHWEDACSAEDNLRRVRADNLLVKASLARVDDVLRILRRRYLRDPDVTEALSGLVKARFPAQSVEQILYWFTARADRLLADAVTEIVYARLLSGRSDTPISAIEAQLHEWSGSGLTETRWSTETVNRVAQGVLATLRDFGILEGEVNKRIRPKPLMLEAFAFAACDLHRGGRTGRTLVTSPEWKLFLMDDIAVERELLLAHQADLLHYEAAGTVVRIDFPARTLRNYARLLIERRWAASNGHAAPS
jgi:hypothetical protein